MQLADYAIELLCNHQQLIVPFNKEQLQPATYDLTLGSEFIRYLDLAIDPSEGIKEGTNYLRMRSQTYGLMPGEFILGTTAEIISLPTDIAGRIEGKSSLGRIGLVVHSTAGFIDPGFRGQVTLELYNMNKVPIILRAGMRIAQMSFAELSGPSHRPYGHSSLGSHYQGQKGTQAADFT